MMCVLFRGMLQQNGTEKRISNQEVKGTSFQSVGHFRVPPDLCIETRLSAQPLIWK